MALKIYVLLFLLNCVMAAYDEKLAREKFLPLASAAYSNNPENCVNNVFSDAVISKKATVRCGDGRIEKKNCFGFVGYSNKNKAIFLVYRGTSDGAQLLNEIYKTISKPKVRAPIGGLISKYFYDAYAALNSWNRLGTTIKYLLWKYPDYNVWVTGHSLGGALASIAAGELVGVNKVPSNKVIMMNFGQPRVGNQEYTEEYEKLVPNAYRIVHANDLVPHVPPSNFDGYRHASRMIWYQGRMQQGSKYVECLAEHEGECTNNQAYSITDHISYFETMFVLHGFTGCKTFNFGEFFKH